jgi:hypothetical protein
MTRTELARRLLAHVLGLGLPLAVLSPIFSGAADSFPLSTYPMFARARGQPTLYSVVARAAGGREERLPPALLGSKEVLQAKVLIQRSVEAGPEALARLCEDTALRVVARAPEFVDARSVAIVARQYEPLDYFVKGPAPLAEQLLFECTLPGRSPSDGAPR